MTCKKNFKTFIRTWFDINLQSNKVYPYEQNQPKKTIFHEEVEFNVLITSGGFQNIVEPFITLQQQLSRHNSELGSGRNLFSAPTFNICTPLIPIFECSIGWFSFYVLFRHLVTQHLKIASIEVILYDHYLIWPVMKASRSPAAQATKICPESGIRLFTISLNVSGSARLHNNTVWSEFMRQRRFSQNDCCVYLLSPSVSFFVL